MTQAQQRAREALSRYDQGLHNYAERRSPTYYVGQFLDYDGCKSSQYGIYGLSGWILLSERIRDHTKVSDLRNRCRDRIAEIVIQAQRCEVNELFSVNTTSYEFEMRFVIPKILYAYEALLAFDETKEQSNILKGYIKSSQNTDGSWGFLTNDCPQPDSGDLLSTAFVLRTFKTDTSFADQVQNGIRFIQSNFKQGDNIYKQLFALNTLKKVSSYQESNLDVQSEIRGAIKNLIYNVYSNPSRSTNPVNIDFYDGVRTRYLRLPSDMIVLESLTLISDPYLLYLQSHFGQRIFDDLLANSRNTDFKNDTTGHRMAVGNLLYIQSVLKLICSKDEVKMYPWFASVKGWITSSAAFGVDFTWNTISFLLSLIGSLIFLFLFLQDKDNKFKAALFGAMLGSLLRSFLELGKSVYNRSKYQG